MRKTLVNAPQMAAFLVNEFNAQREKCMNLRPHVRGVFFAALLTISSVARSETVWFEVGEINPVRAQSFLVPLNDPEQIAHARDLIARGAAAGSTILSASIRAGGDGFNRNLKDSAAPLWSWHVSGVAGFADMAIELCDGWPGFVEQNPQAFINNTNGQICFWGYTVVSELAEAPVFSADEGLDGAWSSPQANSQGLYVDMLGDLNLLAFAWFTYQRGFAPGDESPELRWFSALGEWRGTRSEVTLYATQGGAFAAIAEPQTTAVGTGVIEFEDCDHAQFTYRFDAGPSGTMPLTRTIARPGCVVKPGHPADDELEP